jgi:phytanoyl-CoA hydroxylase
VSLVVASLWQAVIVKRHRLSVNFDWDDAVGPERPRSRVAPEQWEQFRTDGYFVVDEMLDPATVQLMRDETDRFCELADATLAAQPGERVFIAERGAITFAPHIAAQSPVLWEVVSSPPLTDLAADLLDGPVRLYHDQAVYKAPEKPRRFPWHQDNGYGFVEPQHYLTIWIALADIPIESGCVWVAPGLQREGTLEHEYVDPLGWQVFEEPPVEPRAAPLGAGGAVVFSSLTPHLTGPNLSREMRKAYVVQYLSNGAVRHEHDGRLTALDSICLPVP